MSDNKYLASISEATKQLQEQQNFIRNLTKGLSTVSSSAISEVLNKTTYKSMMEITSSFSSVINQFSKSEPYSELYETLSEIKVEWNKSPLIPPRFLELLEQQKNLLKQMEEQNIDSEEELSPELKEKTQTLIEKVTPIIPLSSTESSSVMNTNSITNFKSSKINLNLLLTIAGLIIALIQIPIQIQSGQQASKENAEILSAIHSLEEKISKTNELLQQNNELSQEENRILQHSFERLEILYLSAINLQIEHLKTNNFQKSSKTNDDPNTPTPTSSTDPRILDSQKPMSSTDSHNPNSQ